MNEPRYPIAAVFCNIIGLLVIIGGVIMISEVVHASGSDAAMAIGIGTIFSSVLWFAIASALSMLSKIEFNSRKPRIINQVSPRSAPIKQP